MSSCVAYCRSFSICPSALPLFTSRCADRPASASLLWVAPSFRPLSSASQNGSSPLVTNMIRRVPDGLPPPAGWPLPPSQPTRQPSRTRRHTYRQNENLMDQTLKATLLSAEPNTNRSPQLVAAAEFAILVLLYAGCKLRAGYAALRLSKSAPARHTPDAIGRACLDCTCSIVRTSLATAHAATARHTTSPTRAAKPVIARSPSVTADAIMSLAIDSPIDHRRSAHPLPR